MSARDATASSPSHRIASHPLDLQSHAQFPECQASECVFLCHDFAFLHYDPKRTTGGAMSLHVSTFRLELFSSSLISKRRIRGVRVRATEERASSTNEGENKKGQSQNDLLERIAKAKAYKAAQREQTEPLRPAAPSVFGDELERPEQSARRLSTEEFRARFNRDATESSAPGFREADEDESGPVTGIGFAGSAERRASFLPSDEAVEGMGTDVRPEDFRIAEEERQRSRGAEIISVDKAYKPKVSTWGMFPRPANISETYGGGRKIDPNEPLESAEGRKERNKQIASALLEYKKMKGLYVEPEVEAMFTECFEAGEAFMKKGSLALAAEKFDEAQKIVEFKTKLGGDALLKQAICLDSLGKSRQAKAIYERLSKHPQSEIRTQAKRMLFGFKAMDHLKVAKMKQTDLSADYAEYFAKLPQSWNSTYVVESDVEEVEGFDDSLKLAVWMSGLILFVPLLLFIALAFS